MAKFFIFIILCFSWLGFSLPESQIEKIYTVLEQKTLYKTGFFEGFDGAKLHYLRFGNKAGPKGALVFLSGFGENTYRHMEAYYDFYKAGWSPIYTYDHRGHGSSERFTENKGVVHVESFSNYTEDLHVFLNNIVLKDPKVNSKKLFATSQSMGGAILMDYLQSYAPLFKAVSFAAPLVRVKVPIPVFAFRLFVVPAYTMACIKNCHRKIWSPSFFNKHYHETRLETEEEPLYITSSRVRHRFRDFINEKYNYKGYHHPSYRWVLELSKHSENINDKKRIQSMTTPMIIFQAEKETHVSNRYQGRLCDLLPKTCQLIKIKGAQHALYLEQDKFRDIVIKSSQDFFSKSLKQHPVK